MSNAAIPIVDLSGFEIGTAANKSCIAQAVDDACRYTGFLAINNHGVPQHVIDSVWQAVHDFFDLPSEQKQRVKVLYVGYPYGYMGPEAETLAASRGDTTPPDLKETFNGGPQHIPANVTDADALSFCYAHTPLPAQPANFTQAWATYYSAMEDLAARIMRLFAAALNLPETFFDRYIGSPISALRALNYPAPSTIAKPDQLRAGAHSDYGTLTILLPQHDSRGLEIQRVDGTWHEVLPVSGAFIINIGDLMARWTNDRWKSTLHRVVNPLTTNDAQTRRQSLAYFHQPDWFAEIECLETCVSTDEPKKYESVLSGPYLMSKFRSTV